MKTYVSEKRRPSTCTSFTKVLAMSLLLLLFIGILFAFPSFAAFNSLSQLEPFSPTFSAEKDFPDWFLSED